LKKAKIFLALIEPTVGLVAMAVEMTNPSSLEKSWGINDVSL
jgi:hypothetical protein